MDPAVLLLLQIVLVFVVAFIYANLGLGGGLLFVPILLSTGVTQSDVAVPISLTLTIATAASSVLNHRRKGLVDFRLGRPAPREGGQRARVEHACRPEQHRHHQHGQRRLRAVPPPDLRSRNHRHAPRVRGRLVAHAACYERARRTVNVQ